MLVEKIVLNASPLILLCNGELDFILPSLFTDVVVPEAVWQEIVNGTLSPTAARLLRQKHPQTLVGKVCQIEIKNSSKERGTVPLSPAGILKFERT